MSGNGNCFRHVARVLQPGAAFVLECFVPDPGRFTRGSAVEALEVTEDSATIAVYRHDAAARRYAKREITFTATASACSRGPALLPAR